MTRRLSIDTPVPRYQDAYWDGRLTSTVAAVRSMLAGLPAWAVEQVIRQAAPGAAVSLVDDSARVVCLETGLPAAGLRAGDTVLVRPGHARPALLLRDLTLDELAHVAARGLA